MDFKINTPLKLVSVILLGLILIVMTFATISSSGENKRLKTSINENEQKIKKLETEKITIFESIEKKSEQIRLKDSIIEELKNKEILLINNLKTLKNERTIKQNAYSNNDVSERVRIFSELVSGH
jgi:hypothetical protein